MTVYQALILYVIIQLHICKRALSSLLLSNVFFARQLLTTHDNKQDLIYLSGTSFYFLFLIFTIRLNEYHVRLYAP